jgi:DNA-binding transcriptional MerR regulator
LKVSREKLSQKLEISQKELEKWIENKLIAPIEGSGDSFSEQTLLYGQVVKNFLSMGYSYKEIVKIKNEIGLPLKKDGNDTTFTKSQLLTVGELADKGGVNKRTIKFWEEKGLINPFQRTEGGFRLYRTQDILLVKFIKDLQTFNYTLSEIGNIIRLVEQEFGLGNDMSGDVTPEELDKIVSGLEYLIDYMKEARKASYRVEAVFNRRLKAVLKMIKHERGSAH